MIATYNMYSTDQKFQVIRHIEFIGDKVYNLLEVSKTTID